MNEMQDDYLWDRSGAPDADVQRLEGLLRPLGNDREHAWPAPNTRRLRVGLATWISLAAMLLVTTGAVILGGRKFVERPTIVSAAGSPRLESRAIGGTTRWRAGTVLETDPQSRAVISLPEIGQVDVGAGSRLTFVGSAAGVYRLRLDRGELQAFISAGPGRFVVDTPASSAVDLGCAYTLTVDEGGESRLRVTSGLVALAGASESLIPAGFVCQTASLGRGCTPFAYDASPSIQQALAVIDTAAKTPSQAVSDAVSVLVNDSLDDVTLWHVLQRVQGMDRERIYERLVQVSPPPPDVSRSGVQAGDRAMLDRWWNTFGYGAVEFWRTFSVKMAG